MNRGVHISRESGYTQAEIIALIRGELEKQAEERNKALFPIGYIWMSTVDTDPSTIVGGTWERIQDTFLLAAGSNHDAGDTGGAETVTLTTNQIPAHTHGSKSMSGWIRFRNMTNKGNIVSGSTNDFLNYYAHDSESGDWSSALSYGTTAHKPDRININATHEHTSVGGGGAHNNMPPYLTVYMWERTG